MITIQHLNSFGNYKEYNYRLTEKDIYLDLNDTTGFSMYRMIISIYYQENSLEEQIEKKIEDLLVYIERKQLNYNNRFVHYILGGDLEDLKNFKNKIQNEEFIP